MTPRRCAGEASAVYTLENVTKKPFAKPSSRRPKYRTPLLVVAICIATATALKAQASHNACRRPRYELKKPAIKDETNDPSVNNEVINCWKVL